MGAGIEVIDFIDFIEGIDTIEGGVIPRPLCMLF